MTVISRRRFAAFAALAAATPAALTACSSGASTTTDATSASGAASATGSASAAPANTLTVWVDANREPAMKAIAATFEKDKGVKVNLVVRDFGKIRDDFTVQVPTGKGPDIIIGAHDWIGGFVKDGVVAPIELGDKAAGFEEVAIKAITYEGKTYGLPYAIENIAILRNTKLADSTPATFDEMITKGKAAGKKYPFLIGLDESTGDAFHLYPFQTSFGSQVFAQNADGSYDGTKLALGDDKGAKFAAWLGAQGAAKVLVPGLTGDNAKESFNNGDAPYFISGPWNTADATKAGIELAIDPIPSAGGEEARPFVGVQAFFINAKSANALAANEFLVNYIGTADVQSALFKAGGRPPALTEAFTAAQSDPLIAGFAKVGANGVPMPSVPQMDAVWDDWGKNEVAIMKGADPAATWVKMSQTITGKIAG